MWLLETSEIDEKLSFVKNVGNKYGTIPPIIISKDGGYNGTEMYTCRLDP